MSREIHPSAVDEARSAWRALWDVRADPVEGISHAVPMSLRALDIHPPVRDAIVVSRGRQEITWAGFSLERGMMTSTTVWSGSPSGPDGEFPGLDGWKPLAASLPDRVPPPGRYAHLPFARRPRANLSAQDGLIGQFAYEAWHRFLEAVGIMPAMLAALDPRDDSERRFDRRHAWKGSALRDVVWLAGADPSDGIPASMAGERRRQAVSSMPLLADTFRSEPRLTRLVDEAAELLESAADARSCSPSLLRSLLWAYGRLDPARQECLHGAVRSDATLRMLDAMPGSLVRSFLTGLSVDGWRELATMRTAFVRRDRGLPNAGDMRFDVRDLGRMMRPDPVDGWAWLGTNPDRWAHLDDVLAEMSDELLWPAETRASSDAGRAMWRMGGTRLVAVAMLAPMGPRRVARLLDAHLEGILRGAVEAGHDGKAVSWDVPAPPVTMPAGRTLRFLSTRQELREEGQAMQHCVGGYGDACAERRSAILSIGRWRGSSWIPSSTVEISRTAANPRNVRQHYGIRNGSPDRDDVEVLAAWKLMASEGAFPYDTDLLRIASDATNIEGRLGEAWRTPRAHALRWDRWRRILGTRSRSAGDFMLGIPGFLDDSRRARMATMVVDMEEEMDIARSIELLDRDGVGLNGPDADVREVRPDG